jgi:hypothetical protein
MVDPPSGGPTSHGVCKLCGEERDFPNTLNQDEPFLLEGSEKGPKPDEPKKKYLPHQRPRPFRREKPAVSPPPAAAKEEVSQLERQEVLPDTPESRRRMVRDVALSLTKPGEMIKDKAIVEEIKRQGLKLSAKNPTAMVSTILNGFRVEFEKVEGKRGVFRRKSEEPDLRAMILELNLKFSRLIAELRKPSFTVRWSDERLIFTCPTQEDFDRVSSALKRTGGIQVRLVE